MRWAWGYVPQADDLPMIVLTSGSVEIPPGAPPNRTTLQSFATRTTAGKYPKRVRPGISPGTPDLILVQRTCHVPMSNDGVIPQP
jgi:hypothetical protein